MTKAEQTKPRTEVRPNAAPADAWPEVVFIPERETRIALVLGVRVVVAK